MVPVSRDKVLSLLLIAVVSLLQLTCKQYPYDSPNPGILEIRLRVVNQGVNSSFIPFGPIDSLGQARNQFGVLLRSVDAIRPGEVEFEIFSDLAAIRRNPDGDRFSCLDTLARDGRYVLGTSYAPPETYTGLNIRITPDLFISISSGGFVSNFFEVRRPGLVVSDLQQLLTFDRQPISFTVQEGRLTRVTVAFDLDSSLVRRAEWFEYRPYYYVSSVETF